jgi:hypothetical protein
LLEHVSPGAPRAMQIPSMHIASSVHS